MPDRAYHDELWRHVPPGAIPADFELRSAFLLSRVAPGERVLDLGCGEGAFAAALASTGASVLAADVAAEPLRRARAAHPDLELQLLEQEASWSLPDSAFDVVWAGEVIEHVADTPGWLSEVRRVLRSGGRLLVTTPSLCPSQLLRAAVFPRGLAARLGPPSGYPRPYSRATPAALHFPFCVEPVGDR